MYEIAFTRANNPLMHIDPPAGHGMGNVQDDWEAVEVWLAAVRRKSRSTSGQTMATYRFHLAKLRWYCEYVAGVTPSRWTLQEVNDFCAFLDQLPPAALCRQVEGANGKPSYVGVGDEGYTPFRSPPSTSAQSDIRRFVHAMFKAWHGMGYVPFNPMALEGAGTRRKINAQRAVPPDLVELMLECMEAEEATTFEERQIRVRDRFVLVALRDLGLRTSELIGAAMGAFEPLTDPKNAKTYWIFRVSDSTAKGGAGRAVPAPRTVMEALAHYRQAFGMSALPSGPETTPLVLSPRTGRVKSITADRPAPDATSRRFFGQWLPVQSRSGLYRIVKGRMAATARFLESVGDTARKELMERSSPHWLRHAFGKARLLASQDLRQVAAALGHRDIGTTMAYTEQGALDLIRAMEESSPELLAGVAPQPL